MNPLLLPELREMLADDNVVEMQEFCTALNAGRTAEFMEGLDNPQIWSILRHAEPERRAEVFSFFEEYRQVEMLEAADLDSASELIGELPADDRVDLIQQLDEPRVADILRRLPLADRRDIQRLTQYEDGTAGSIMTTQVAKLDQELSVRGALETLGRLGDELETIYYLYVVEDDRLRGIVSTRQLVSSLKRPDRTLGELMETDVVAALATDDQESVAQKVERFDLLAIPVVDDSRRLLGIITHDDIIDVVREEYTEDIQRSAAVEPLEDDFLQVGLWTLSWKRGLWLTILFFAALLTAFALRHYDVELEAYAWLVAFIPLIISAGGNSGSQSATLVITAMTAGQVTFADWFQVLRRELVVSLVLGGFLAAIGYSVAVVLAPNPSDAAVIPITLLAVIVCGCLFGAALPMLFKRLGLDPALMSNPFVAGIVDILGIVIYINVARVLLA